MTRNLLLSSLFCLFLGANAHAQLSINFDDFLTESDTFYNGFDGSTSHDLNGALFPTKWITDFGGYWGGGWAVSSMRDDTTSGPGNLYSAKTGKGYDGSTSYAIGNPPFGSDGVVIRLNNRELSKSIQITNTTYAYNSMRDSDQFAKKFGGDDGIDPDFFLLTIKGYLNGNLSNDSVDFYLADYRFDNDSLDYIVDEWTEVDLSPLGLVDSLFFSLSSSDNNMGGMMNTPAFFGIDQLNFDFYLGATSIEPSANIQVHPTLADQQINVKTEDNIQQFNYQLFSSNGQLIDKGLWRKGDAIPLKAYANGAYYIRFFNKETEQSLPFFIQH